MTNALALLLLVGGGVAIYSGISGKPVMSIVTGALKLTSPQSAPVPSAGK